MPQRGYYWSTIYWEREMIAIGISIKGSTWLWVPILKRPHCSTTTTKNVYNHEHDCSNGTMGDNDQLERAYPPMNGIRKWWWRWDNSNSNNIHIFNGVPQPGAGSNDKERQAERGERETTVQHTPRWYSSWGRNWVEWSVVQRQHHTIIEQNDVTPRRHPFTIIDLIWFDSIRSDPAFTTTNQS